MKRSFRSVGRWVCARRVARWVCAHGVALWGAHGVALWGARRVALWGTRRVALWGTRRVALWGVAGAPGCHSPTGRVVEARCRATFLAACAAALGLAAVVAGCAGPAGTGSAPRAVTGAFLTSAPTGVPAGYQRVGGSAQGISIAIPSSWATVNLAQVNLGQALKQIGLKGVSRQTLSQNLQELIKLHAVFATDLKSMASSPGHFATNINAYCSNSGTSDTGTAGVPLLRQSAETELPQVLHAQHVTVTDVNIGGVPGVQVGYTLTSTTAGTLHAAQLEVLPKPGRACFVTLTATGPLPTDVLATAAATAQYP